MPGNETNTHSIPPVSESVDLHIPYKHGGCNFGADKNDAATYYNQKCIISTTYLISSLAFSSDVEVQYTRVAAFALHLLLSPSSSSHFPCQVGSLPVSTLLSRGLLHCHLTTKAAATRHTQGSELQELYVEWGSTNTTDTSVFMMKISHILKCEGK